MEYDKVIIGGTFDRFHIGHEAFLDKAFHSAKKIIIGLTTSVMLKKIVRQDSIWAFKERKKIVENFVKKYKKEFSIIPIEDIFGPAIEIEDLDAIIATEETKHTCERINQIRKRKGFKPLEIILVPFVYAEDCKIISSSRIRNGEIDRNGKILVDYSITNRLREDLKTPKSMIFEGDNLTVTKDVISYMDEEGIDDIVCVGDEVSHDFLENGFKPRNIIIDGKVKRKQIDYFDEMIKKYANRFSISNSPGIISKESWRILKDALKKESVVIVKGEEDLLVVPAILLVENNTTIVYGQPGRGKVIVKVDENKKEYVRQLLTHFNTIHR
jgi:pantetheine-phosphate adenylyltransferase